MPAYTLVFIEFFRPNERHHSLLVQTILLCEIQEVESDFLGLVIASILRVNTEEEPLLVHTTVGIQAHYEVVLVITVAEGARCQV